MGLIMDQLDRGLNTVMAAQEPKQTLKKVVPENTLDDTKLERLGMVPDLVPYTGTTRVGLSPDQLASLEMINSILSGDPTQQQNQFGHLERTVLGPARQSLTEQVLPALAEIYSGGATGSAFNTGARREAQADALTEYGEASARLRAEQPARKLNEIAQGFQMQDLERQNEMANINRDIAVHYQNQGLSQAEFQMDMQAINSALSESGFDWQRYVQERGLGQQDRAADLQEMQIIFQQQQALEAQEDAQRSGLFGGLGSIFGGLLGLAGGPLGVMAGSSIGGGIGQTIGGSPQYGMGNIMGGIETTQLPGLMDLFSGAGQGSRPTLSGTALSGNTMNTLNQPLDNIGIGR